MEMRLDKRWHPQKMGKEKFKKGKGNIINKVKLKLHDKNISIVNELFDKQGTVGYETKKHIVVGKKYIYGYIVSAHIKIVDYAKNTKKKLLMYIDDYDSFYEFNPLEIISKGNINHRDEIEMLNWNVSLGKRIVLIEGHLQS